MSDASPQTYKQFLDLAGKGNVVPVYKRIIADLLTPVSAYLKIAQHGRRSFLLESVEGGEKIARYSFLGIDPHLVIKGRKNRVSIISGGEALEKEGKFIAELRRHTSQYRYVAVPDLPPFAGGAVGYLAYDAVRWFERIPDNNRDDLQLDDAEVMFFSNILAFDHLKHQILIISNVFTGGAAEGLENEYELAMQRIEQMERLLAAPIPEKPKRIRQHKREVRQTITKEEHEKGVLAAKEYIAAGDAFQIVYSLRFDTDVTADPFQIYRALRMVNPSPYMFFLKLDDAVILGASPEMLVRCKGRELEYRPIAGTRPRGKSEEEDLRLEQEMLADEKERAEHVMLVDLGRNDLGRVSEYGSVKVEKLMFVERYSHVMHLVSSLRGRLREGLDCYDALAACFPAGTLTGAPKVRAMEIIDELEVTRRGIYGGAVMYLDYSGNLDSCIAIRTLMVKDGRAYVQAGGGIVADSVPELEYQEIINKAQAVLRAIEIAETEL